MRSNWHQGLTTLPRNYFQVEHPFRQLSVQKSKRPLPWGREYNRSEENNSSKEKTLRITTPPIIKTPPNVYRMPAVSKDEKQSEHAFTPANHLTRTPPQQISKPAGPPACPEKREIHLIAKKMAEREKKEKEKSNKRKNVKCKSKIRDIMIKMKNAIRNLEKQYISNKSQWIKIKILRQLKKIAKYMK